MTLVLYVVWIIAYLAGVLWVSRRYREHAYANGPLGRNEYRADKDPGLRVAIFALGVLLFVAVYLITKLLG